MINKSLLLGCFVIGLNRPMSFWRNLNVERLGKKKNGKRGTRLFAGYFSMFFYYSKNLVSPPPSLYVDGCDALQPISIFSLLRLYPSEFIRIKCQRFFFFFFSPSSQLFHFNGVTIVILLSSMRPLILIFFFFLFMLVSFGGAMRYTQSGKAAPIGIGWNFRLCTSGLSSSFGGCWGVCGSREREKEKKKVLLTLF